MDLQLQERARHLDALNTWLKDAVAGNGRLVFIGGEAGVGKTALVNRFCQLAQGRARVLRGECDVLSTPRPLGPLLDIADAVGGELARLLTAEAPRDQVFRAALAELGSALTPALAIIEDAHWADEATLDALRFFGRRLETTRALILVTYRDEEVGPTHPLRVVLGDLATNQQVRRLELEPLTVDGIRELAKTYTGGTQLDLIALHQLTGGNPFFASEILCTEPISTGRIPVTVRDAVLARASRLSSTGRTAIEAAAVLGSPIDGDLLTEITGLPVEAIESCLSVGMLISKGNHHLAFRHELSRTAIYDAISPPRLRELHAAVLTALSAAPAETQDASRLAHHAEAAGDHQAVLTYALIAAKNASALGANREASAQYARALRFTTGLPSANRLTLLEGYAEASDLAGSGSAGIATREEMIALARQSGDHAKEAEHLGWLADSLALEGLYDCATNAANAALAILPDGPESSAHAKVYYHQAHIRMINGDAPGALLWGNRCIGLATKLGDVRSLLLGLNVIGEARLTGGDEAQGRADLERCFAIAREAGFDGFAAGALANLGSGHAETYRFHQAETCLTEAIAFATEREDDNWRNWGLVWLAHTRLFQGNWSDAVALARSIVPFPSDITTDRSKRDHLGFASSNGSPLYIQIVALLVMGRIQARRGDPAADDLLAEALELAGSNRSFRQIAPIRAARAEAAWLVGDHERLVVEVRAALDHSVGSRQRWLEGELASWLWRAGEITTPPPHIAPPYRLQLAGDWAAAATAWDELGCPYEAALARLDGDELAVRDALATFDRLGAQPASAIATRRLRTLGARGITRGPRPSTRANAAGLTARELDVLPLLAAGQRTEEIAARLFVSRKTVEHHISHILAKLDVRTRHDVAAAANRLGLRSSLDQDRGSAPPI